MLFSQLGTSNLLISKIILGTWAFGGDKIWWGGQSDQDSEAVMEFCIEQGINTFDTAPIYGKGRSETVIGNYLKKKRNRDKVILATKCGLSWDKKKVWHDLSDTTILKEFDESRKRLQTDVIDLYQIHFPDKNQPIEKVATTLRKLWEKKLIKAIGVSNFTKKEMTLFLKEAPIHSSQSVYNLFARHIEKKNLPFCLEYNIAILPYSPLQQGILTGKYHLKNQRPKGIRRRTNPDLNSPRFEITKNALMQLNILSESIGLTLSQLSLNWLIHQEGVTASIVGMRNTIQAKENIHFPPPFDHKIIEKINQILKKRKEQNNVISKNK